jgi:hypothetical protein
MDRSKLSSWYFCAASLKRAEKSNSLAWRGEPSVWSGNDTTDLRQTEGHLRFLGGSSLDEQRRAGEVRLRLAGLAALGMSCGADRLS